MLSSEKIINHNLEKASPSQKEGRNIFLPSKYNFILFFSMPFYPISRTYRKAISFHGHLSLGLGRNVYQLHDPKKLRSSFLVSKMPITSWFAGDNKHRAFITCAHRGQNNPHDPQLTQQGVGRADLWVFDRNNLGSSMGGQPETILTLFSDTPRALAVSPSGDMVYATPLHSGNQTTAVGNLSLLPLRKTEPTTRTRPLRFSIRSFNFAGKFNCSIVGISALI